MPEEIIESNLDKKLNSFNLKSENRGDYVSAAFKRVDSIKTICPYKWLPVKIRIDFDDRTKKPILARLPMGNGFFKIELEENLDFPIATPKEEIILFRTPMPYPLYLPEKIDCFFEYPILFALQNRMDISDVNILDISQASYSINEFIINDNYKNDINFIKKELTEYIGVSTGIKLDQLSMIIYITIGVCILSILSSLILRKIYYQSNIPVGSIFFGYKNNKNRLTVFDGPHLYITERLVRMLMLAFPIFSPPIIHLTLPYVLAYQTKYNEISFMSKNLKSYFDIDFFKEISKNSTILYFIFIEFFLLANSFHQGYLIFSRKMSISNK
ncbi:hypothetical protein [Methylomonas methanica]|uniref:hypothetical protein n=1 Tax=Methylomonas methanica TaxID=421 RepID=UPI0011D260CA|nr:hypothetical protein [Methylomonas methanica]